MEDVTEEEEEEKSFLLTVLSFLGLNLFTIVGCGGLKGGREEGPALIKAYSSFGR